MLKQEKGNLAMEAKSVVFLLFLAPSPPSYEAVLRTADHRVPGPGSGGRRADLICKLLCLYILTYLGAT